MDIKVLSELLGRLRNEDYIRQIYTSMEYKEFRSNLWHVIKILSAVKILAETLFYSPKPDSFLDGCILRKWLIKTRHDQQDHIFQRQFTSLNLAPYPKSFMSYILNIFLNFSDLLIDLFCHYAMIGLAEIIR